jgi:hypothetical protein
MSIDITTLAHLGAAAAVAFIGWRAHYKIANAKEDMAQADFDRNVAEEELKRYQDQLRYCKQDLERTRDDFRRLQERSTDAVLNCTTHRRSVDILTERLKERDKILEQVRISSASALGELTETNDRLQADLYKVRQRRDKLVQQRKDDAKVVAGYVAQVNALKGQLAAAQKAHLYGPHQSQQIRIRQDGLFVQIQPGTEERVIGITTLTKGDDVYRVWHTPTGTIPDTFKAIPEGLYSARYIGPGEDVCWTVRLQNPMQGYRNSTDRRLRSPR